MLNHWRITRVKFLLIYCYVVGLDFWVGKVQTGIESKKKLIVEKTYSSGIIQIKVKRFSCENIPHKSYLYM